MKEKKTLHVISAYINKKDTFSDVLVSNDPKRYVQEELQSNVLPESSVLKNAEIATVKAQISLPIAMVFFLAILLGMMFQMRMKEYQLVSDYMEDAVAMSNLASAIMDVELYGKSHEIRVADEEEAFRRFENALKSNLMLNSRGVYEGNLPIEGEVKVVSYHIYNVRNSIVECVVMDGNGKVLSRMEGVLGEVHTPDEVKVESTTIYSKVSFCVKGIGKGKIWGTKEKSVDIVRKEE